jgi:acyl transferase domain-containing protein
VSSFGFGGTNAHVVVAGYEGEQPEAISGASNDADAAFPERSAHALLLSGKTRPALQDLAGRYVAWLADHADADLADVCFTAATGRSHFEHRAGVVVESHAQLSAALRQLAAGESTRDVHVGHHRQQPKTALLFTGQGSQYPGMAQELYATQPVFKKTLDQCAELLAHEFDQPLLKVIFGDSANFLDQTRYTQPALFAIEAALYEMYKSFGVEADVVLGHSVGEYAAAYAAGVFSLADGLKLIAKRGSLFGVLPSGGSMAAIFAEVEQVEAAIKASNSHPSPLTSHLPVSIAAYNGTHVVISGPVQKIDEVVSLFEADGVHCPRLKTSHAFHSALLDPALDGFEQFAATIDYRPAERTLISNLTGEPLAAGQVIDANYWRRHASDPVQFARCVRALGKTGCSVLLELGPHPALTAMAQRCWQAATFAENEREPRGIASLRRNTPADRSVSVSIAQLYASGCAIDCDKIDTAHSRRKLRLPTYPFQRQRHWLDVPNARNRPSQQTHPLLGERHESASGEVTFTVSGRFSRHYSCRPIAHCRLCSSLWQRQMGCGRSRCSVGTRGSTDGRSTPAES